LATYSTHCAQFRASESFCRIRSERLYVLGNRYFAIDVVSLTSCRLLLPARVAWMSLAMVVSSLARVIAATGSSCGTPELFSASKIAPNIGTR